MTTEAGGTATFTVVLDTPPAANVSIFLDSSDTTEGTVAPASLTSTPSNWDTLQVVTVTGVSDGLLDGDIAYTILTAATSTDPVYDGIPVADVGVTNIDVTGACTYMLTPINQVVNAGATAGGQVAVTTQTGCEWTATSPVPWVTITGESAGTGSGSVTYSVAANAGPNPRRGTMTIAGKLFIVSQRTPVPAPCTISASTPATPVAVGGSTGRNVTIVASTASCAWSAKSHVAWITLTSAPTGSGDGSVSFSVAANGTGLPRKGRITVNGKRVVVAQN
ncbi:MAG: BACON domain-containing protein [Deltaproteobacteria bacterium]|nr:BACON domain-containing protein [Deltaproteobacteria bacterium]